MQQQDYKELSALLESVPRPVAMRVARAVHDVIVEEDDEEASSTATATWGPGGPAQGAQELRQRRESQEGGCSLKRPTSPPLPHAGLGACPARIGPSALRKKRVTCCCV